MTTLRSFTLFPSLPTELRLKIYTEITLSQPHILKISYSPSQNRYIANTAPPLTLSISSESRAQTLLTYSYLHLGLSPSEALDRTKKTPQIQLYTGASSPYQRHYQQLSNRSIPISKACVPKSTASSALAIPISWEKQTLYVSALSPLLSTMHFQHTFLFHLSTSQSRHLVKSLAIDLRVWNELCENGFLGVVARMKGLRDLKLVVEFGRVFKGALDWLEAPEYRKDLRWVAKTATRDIERERASIRSKGQGTELGKVEVTCVILTRGGEQA